MELKRDKRFVSLESKFEGTFEVLTAGFQFDGLDRRRAIDRAVARFNKLLESASGPVVDNGYIPPTLICTEAEVVRWFGFNAHREKLLERIRTWISLARGVKARRLLLNGSFVTAKDEPGDVDAAVLLPEDFHDRLRAGDSEAVELHEMLFTRQPKELFAAEDEENWWRWVEFFGKTRQANGRRKGLIEVTL